MSEPANTLPPEWKECAADTVRALAVARHLAARHATEETPESVLLPALLLSGESVDRWIAERIAESTPRQAAGGRTK